jgi:hypothetical protein
MLLLLYLIGLQAVQQWKGVAIILQLVEYLICLILLKGVIVHH